VISTAIKNINENPKKHFPFLFVWVTTTVYDVDATSHRQACRVTSPVRCCSTIKNPCSASSLIATPGGSGSR